jgi:DNA-binding SARP family transcriptional activator
VSLAGPDGASARRASQQRRIALLALIASAPGGSITRDRLLGLLWPDRDERTARHLLADSLYVLRRTLGDAAIVTTADAVRLSPDHVWSDVAEFRRALEDERWSDAVALYRGDFLDGFYVRNAVDFDQWAASERARLNTLATRAASAQVSALESAGCTADAVVAAERALELAPYDEAVFRDLIRLLLLSENRTRAAAAARGFVERLAFDIGASPSVETLRIVRGAAGASPNGEGIIVLPAAKRLGRPGATVDSETASILARARHHWHQRTRVSVERAIAYFTRAAERDARAVDAWFGLSDCWVVMGGRGYVPVGDAIDRAAASAERALRLDDARSSVHAAIGGVNILRRRWHDAERALRHAILLDPQNADAHHWLSLTLLTGFGSREEAIREQAIATRLNPVAPVLSGALAWQRYLRGEYDSSRSSMEPVLHLNAELEEGHAGLARVAARMGDEATVMTALEAGLAKRCDLRGDLLAEHASALAVLGDSARGRRVAFEASAHGAAPLQLAFAWASTGDADRAFRWLEGESFHLYSAPADVWWDPRFEAIRDDARFRRVRAELDRVWRPEWS